MPRLINPFLSKLRCKWVSVINLARYCVNIKCPESKIELRLKSKFKLLIYSSLSKARHKCSIYEWPKLDLDKLI